MHKFMILASIGTEQDTLVFYLTQMLTDGRMVERTEERTDKRTES